MEHIIVAVFSVESETFQAFSKCKEHLGSSRYLVSQMFIIKKIDNTLKIQESFIQKLKHKTILLSVD